MRRRLVALLATGWVLTGGAGVWAYAHGYYVYRGFRPPRNPPGVAAGRLAEVAFRSRALGSTRSYAVYLPPGYAAAAARGRRFGVLYLLHGSPGWPRLFINAGGLGLAMDPLVDRREIRPFLIVLPDGRDGTFASDTEWANTRHGAYESFVLEVVHDVDHRWPTIPDRAHRVLAGNSEGGYAAANLTLRHIGVFGAFESWSGYFTQTPTGVFAHASRAELDHNSPLQLARRRCAAQPRPSLAAVVYGGSKDPDTRQIPAFAAALRACGARVAAQVLPGRHDWRLWRDRTPAMLRWAADTMAGRP